MNREYPDTLMGRAASWVDMIGEEHGHPASLEHADMAENMAAAERLFRDIVLDLGETQTIGGMMGSGAAHDVMVRGGIAPYDLALMFQGIFVTGAALGARIQAGLHS